MVRKSYIGNKQYAIKQKNGYKRHTKHSLNIGEVIKIENSLIMIYFEK